MPSMTYRSGQLIIARGEWTAGEFGVLLATKDYKPKTEHAAVADVEHELRGGGYKRVRLAAREVKTTDTGRVDLVAGPVTLDALYTKQHYRWIVVYRVGKSDEESRLFCALDTGEDVDLTGIYDHTIKWDGRAGTGRVLSLAG
jgi:hypothetical protein